MNALKVTQRNWFVYRRTWRNSLFFSFLHPLLFLTAMGLGLGALIERQGNSNLGGVPYLAFVGPGLLAATAMQSASFDASFGTVSKVTWRKTYEAMIATPLSVKDLVWGELAWQAVHLLYVTVPFFLAILILRPPTSPLGVLAIPAAVLTGLAVATAMMGYSATKTSFNDMSGILRFVVTPMFLFSGTFFPIERLPDAIEPLAWATPLFHGVKLVRGVMLGRSLEAWPIHLAYLVVFFLLGTFYATRTLEKKLIR